MQFYTFLETSLVTLSLLPHFIAFFSDGEIPGTPGTLATTFLAFGKIDRLFSLPCIGFSLFSIMIIVSLCSFESGVCFKCHGVSDHAYILGSSKYHYYWGTNSLISIHLFSCNFSHFSGFCICYQIELAYYMFYILDLSKTK